MSDTDYDSLKTPPVKTRSSADMCTCYLCQRGRDTLVPFVANQATSDPVMKICAFCKSKVAPGLQHICNRRERNENIIDIVKNLSPMSKSQIMSESLKGKLILNIL